jgi:hypothetical protein
MTHPNNNPALVRSTSDAEQVSRARESESDRRDRQDAELRGVLNSYPGRSVIWRVLEQCGIYELSFSGDSHRTAFREGNRNVGLFLLTEVMRVAPDAYGLMQRESVARTQRMRDPNKKRRNKPSGEPATPRLVESELTVEEDDGN